MYKFLITCILFLSFTLSANATESFQFFGDIAKKFKFYINYDVNSKLTSNQKLQCQDNLEELYQQCVSSICGSPDEMYNNYDIVNDFIDNSQKLAHSAEQIKLKDELSKQLSKYMSDQAKLDSDIIQMLLRQIEANELTVNGSSLAFHNLSFLSSMSDFLHVEYNPETGFLEVKTFKEGMLKKSKYHLTPEEKKWVIDSIAEIKIFEELTPAFFDPKKWFLSRNPGKSLSDAIRLEAKLVEAMLEEAKNQNPTLYRQLIFSGITSKETINNILSGDISSIEVSTLEDFATSLALQGSFLHIVLNPQNYPVLNSKKVRNLNSFINRFMIKEALQAQEKKFLNHSDYNARINEVIEKCYYGYFLGHILPTQEEIAHFNLQTSKLKQEFKTNALRRYSTPTQRKLQKIIDDTEFIYPVPFEKFHDYYQKEIDKLTSSLKELRAKYYGLYSDRPQANLLYLYEFINSKPKQLFEELEEKCLEISPSTHFKDAAKSVSGKVLVSWQSIKFPEGKSIVFHELGHIVHAALEFKKMSNKSVNYFQDTIQCLVSLHPAHYQTKYSEEDFADLLSSVSIQDNNKNSWCVFIEQEMSKGYNQPKLVYKNYSLINEYEEDVHSSDLFRLLHKEYLAKNRLPHECNSYLQVVETEFPIQNCYAVNEK